LQIVLRKGVVGSPLSDIFIRSQGTSVIINALFAFLHFFTAQDRQKWKIDP
jgi:hypothetical protein